MRASRLSIVLLLAAVSSSCSPSGGPSDADARRVIERLRNQPDVGLLLGDIKFVSENADGAKRRDSVKEWPLYEAFAREGVLTLKT